MIDVNFGGESSKALSDMVKNHVRQFAVTYLGAKVAIAKKLADAIEKESDPDKLMKLRSQLNTVMFSKDDVDQLGELVASLVQMFDRNIDIVIAIRKKWIDALDPHGGGHYVSHGHGDHGNSGGHGNKPNRSNNGNSRTQSGRH